MPFQSKAQARYLFAEHPDIAKRWAGEYGVPSTLPDHKKQLKQAAINASQGKVNGPK